ncbi:MAG: fructosamine kinase family protein [Verrucomicrobiota bacterium]
MNTPVIAEAISEAMGKSFRVESTQSVGGGCINEAFRLVGSDASYFVKINRATWLDMFIAEAEGLNALRQTDALKAPQPICYGVDASQAYLVLEHLPLRSLSSAAQTILGKQLAQLHRTTSDQFGWQRDNTIGSTPQVNTRMDEWSQFYAEHRLGYQFDLAAQQGLKIPDAAELCDSIETFFTDYHPKPSLLHGDLWGGNAAMDDAGNPVIFDPACYFGDRESDIAFTEMFGGFSSAFYQAYQSEWPLNAGYQQRKDLYNLYHVLNHYNLFGGGYGMQAQGMVVSLLHNIGKSRK